MADPVNVLVWGTAEQGPCAYYRGGHLYDDILRDDYNIHLRHISKLDFRVDPAYRGRPSEAFSAGAVEVDDEPFKWSDVLLMRRYYNTAYKCAMAKDDDYLNDKDACHFRTTDAQEAGKHEHGFRDQDGITRAIWPAIRDSYTGGIIYETDDDHWRIQPWNGYYPDVIIEHDLIEDMARRADLLTVSTPQLGRRYGQYNPRIRVVRNAIDPTLYTRDRPVREHSKPRLVYYGSTARLRDYLGPQIINRHTKLKNGYAYEAVEERRNRLTAVFLGTNPGTERIISQFFDEQIPYIEGIAAFSKALVHTDGDIGIAPLGGDDFDRAKSELHWLEYAMADQAFIGERFKPLNGDTGPYGMIVEGKDGLLAAGRSEWSNAIERLLVSPQLRADMAGAAKERVLAEYDYRIRAPEWADAFRWAAEHPGIGLRKPEATVAA